MARALPIICAALAMTLLTACEAERDTPLDELFPPQAGQYLRAQGPSPDPATGVDQAVYQGPEGIILLRIKRVGKDQVAHALSQLPPAATDIRADPALGQRQGTFFTFGGQFHAAWGNRDWVFVLSAPSDAARIVFLAGYGY